MANNLLEKNLQTKFHSDDAQLTKAHNEFTLEVAPEALLQTLTVLRDDAAFQFDTLIDVCGVDYGAYGLTEWQTADATSHGFSRAREETASSAIKPKLAVVYHLLSTSLNHRIRVRAYCNAELPVVPSVVSLWVGASWFEREAYDLFGILFEGHPDLRRILTDYGFIGHPFRKDFPVSGYVEMRYDAASKRCVYGPVEIEPRVLVPRVVRDDNRSQSSEGAQ